MRKGIFIIICSMLVATTLTAQRISTIAGGGKWANEGVQASAAQVNPFGLSLRTNGDLFFSDPQYHVVRKIAASGVLTTIAGSDSSGYGGDGGDAKKAKLFNPQGIASDGLGNLYIADRGNNRIRKVDANGIMTTVAGKGTAGYSGDGGAGNNALLNAPTHVYVDPSGNLLIADNGNSRIRKLDTKGIITTIAGGGLWTTEGANPVLAENGLVSDVHVSSKGIIYWVDRQNHSVRMITAGGTVQTIAGRGIPGFSGDGGPSTLALLFNPSGIATDTSGNIYIADAGNARIRKIDKQNIISTVAGTETPGYNVDAGPATTVRLNNPTDVATDLSGNLYVTDQDNHLIRKIDRQGILTTIAGNRVKGFSGDGGLAIFSGFSSPNSIVADSIGNIYISDNGNSRIRKISTKGIVSTYAGDGNRTYAGDGGEAVNASLAGPYGMSIDRVGNLFVADSGSSRIRRISSEGFISTVAGTGVFSFSGDGSRATIASINRPLGVAVDQEGSLYIADTYNNRIRKVQFGIIYTFSGTGRSGLSGNVQDGQLASTVFQVFPNQITGDANGNIYFTESRNRIRRISPNGIITTFAGNVQGGTSPDGTLASNAFVSTPQGITVDRSGNIIFSNNNTIRRIETNGILSTIAGNGSFTFGGDGGPSNLASFSNPPTIATDASGNIYLSDVVNRRIRKIDINGIITTYAGTGTISFGGDGGQSLQSQISNPGGIKLDSKGNIYFVDRGNFRVRRILTSGEITSLAGNGLQGNTGDGGPATAASISNALDVAINSRDSTLYIADRGSFRIRAVSSVGVIRTYAGNGSSTLSGDGGPATSAGIGCPAGMLIDRNENLYIADECNRCIRRVQPNGIISLFAGNGSFGSDGDGGQAIAASFISPGAMVQDKMGSIYILDRGAGRVRKITNDGIITTIAGGGTVTSDSAVALSALIPTPTGLAVDGSGNVFIHFGNKINKVSPDGTMIHYAGNGRAGFGGDAGPAISSSFSGVDRMAADSMGSLYLSDAANNRIRKITPCLTSPARPVITSNAGQNVVCQNSGLVLRSSFTGLNQWYFNGNPVADSVGSSLAPASNGIYSVRSIDANGCASDFSFNTPVTIQATPSVPQHRDTAICKDKSSGTMDLKSLASSTLGNTLRWYGRDSVGGSATIVAPIAPTSADGIFSYYVCQVNTGGCESPRAKIVVTVSPTPVAPVVTPVVLCNGAAAEPLKVNPLPGNNLKWYSSPDLLDTSGKAVAPIPSTITTGSFNFYVSQIAPGGCESIRAKLEVAIKPRPTILPEFTPASFCKGSIASPLSASASFGRTLSWYGLDSTGGVGRILPTQPSTDTVGLKYYFVSESNGVGCDGPRAKIPVTILPLPLSPIFSSLAFCRNANVDSIKPKGLNEKYLWYSTAIGGIATAQPSTITANAGNVEFYISLVDSKGCESTRSKLSILINETPAAPLVSPLILCKDAVAGQLSVNANPGNILQWYDTSATGGVASVSVPVLSTAVTGKLDYYVSQKNSTTLCESSRSKLTVTVSPVPEALPSRSLSLCQREVASPLTATPSSGNVLVWFGSNATGGSPSPVSPVPATNVSGNLVYYVAQKSAAGCIGTRSPVNVSVTAAPSQIPQASPISFCQGTEATQLIAGALSGNSLKWYGMLASGGTASASAPIPSTTSAGVYNYYVSQQTPGGCESPRAKLTVTINSLPQAPGVVAVKYCQNDKSQTLQASSAPGNTLLWYGFSASGGVSSPLAPSPSTTLAGNVDYYVSQRDVQGCESRRAKLTLTIKELPPMPDVKNISSCINSNAVPLTATVLSGNTTLWYNNVSGGSATILSPIPSTNALGAVVYYVSQRDNLSGCESPRAKITATVYAYPAKPSILRDAQGNLLSSSSAGNQWYKDNVMIQGATLEQFKPGFVGFYALMVTQNGCSSPLSDTYYYLTTSISNVNAEQGFRLYPNPVSERLFIDLNQTGLGTLHMKIFSASGQIVKEDFVVGSGTSFDVSGLRSGVYRVNLFNKNGKLLYSQWLMVNH